MAIQKVYQYKIYSPAGDYLGMLQNVQTDFSYNQQIATTFVQTEIGLAQAEPDALTVNDNLIRIYEVSPYYPAGHKVFDGYISKWKAIFGGSGDGMNLTCISHGQDASQYVIEAGDSPYISQATENANNFQIGDQDAFGQSYTVAIQTFTLAANKTIGSVDVMVSTQEATNLTAIIRQRIGSNPDVGTDPIIMSGTVACVSGLVKSVQHIVFNSPAQLNTGNTYYMEIAWGSNGVSTCQIWCNNANPYASGACWTQVFAPPASWNAAVLVPGGTGVDLYFIVYQHGGSVVTTYTSRDPTFMLADLMASYNQRGGLIQTPPNPITPLQSIGFSDTNMPGANWGVALAQPITPAADTVINIVQLLLGSSSSSEVVTVQLVKGNPALDTISVIGGSESYSLGGSNTILASTNSRTISNPTASLTGFSFPTPQTLLSGQQYYFLIEFGQSAFAGLIMKGAGSTDTISSPWGQMYLGLVTSNNTSSGMATSGSNKGMYINIGYVLPVPSNLDGGYAATGVSTSYTFRQQTMLRAIQVLATLAPFDWYWYVSPEDNVLHFAQASAVAEITLIKGRHINELQIEATKETIVNAVYFTGGDNGAGTNTSVSVKKTATIGSNRVGLAQISDNRVSGVGGAAVGAVIAQDYLNQFANETYITNVTVQEGTIDTSLFQPGMMVGFRGFGDFADALVLQVVGKTKSPDNVQLQLGTLPVRSSQAVAEIEAGLAYQQTVNNPSVPS